MRPCANSRERSRRAGAVPRTELGSFWSCTRALPPPSNPACKTRAGAVSEHGDATHATEAPWTRQGARVRKETRAGGRVHGIYVHADSTPSACTKETRGRSWAWWRWDGSEEAEKEKSGEIKYVPLFPFPSTKLGSHRTRSA
jgi:hypothetical protein